MHLPQGDLERYVKGCSEIHGVEVLDMRFVDKTLGEDCKEPGDSCASSIHDNNNTVRSVDDQKNMVSLQSMNSKEAYEYHARPVALNI